MFSPIVGKLNGKKVFLAGKKAQQNQGSSTNLDTINTTIAEKGIGVKPSVSF